MDVTGSIITLGVAFAGGYVASIVTWPWVRTKFAGAEAEIARLRDRIAKVNVALRS